MHKNCLCFYAHALYIELQLQTIIFYILISMLLLKNNFFLIMNRNNLKHKHSHKI